MKVPINESKVYSFLSNEKKRFFTVDYLAELLKMPEKDVISALNNLKDQKLVTKKKLREVNYAVIYGYQYKGQEKANQNTLFI